MTEKITIAAATKNYMKDQYQDNNFNMTVNEIIYWCKKNMQICFDPQTSCECAFVQNLIKKQTVFELSEN